MTVIFSYMICMHSNVHALPICLQYLYSTDIHLSNVPCNFNSGFTIPSIWVNKSSWTKKDMIHEEHPLLCYCEGGSRRAIISWFGCALFFLETDLFVSWSELLLRWYTDHIPIPPVFSVKTRDGAVAKRKSNTSPKEKQHINYVKKLSNSKVTSPV